MSFIRSVLKFILGCFIFVAALTVVVGIIEMLAAMISGLAWVIAGLFYVGMPYLLRDAIQWVTADRNRLKSGAIAGAVYGLALVACALAFWRT